MTEDNQRENMRAELDRVTEALAATLLYENGYIETFEKRLHFVIPA